MSDEYDLFRETFGKSSSGQPAQVKPYGELEGILLKFDKPLDNYDASRPYFLTVTVTVGRHGDKKDVAQSFTLQQICRTVGGKFSEGHYRGEEPIL